MIWRCPLGGNHRTPGSRQVHKLLSGRYWWAGVEQCESAKMASTACVPWEQLCRPLNMCQTWSLPLSPKLQDKQSSPSQKDWCVFCSPLSVQCPVGGSLPRTILLIATLHGTQESKLLHPQSQAIKGCPLDVSCKNQVPHACKDPFQETLTLWGMAKENTKIVPTLRGLERVTVNPETHVQLEAYPLGHNHED